MDPHGERGYPVGDGRRAGGLLRLRQLGDDRLQSEPFIQLADDNQASVGRDARSLKRDLQKPVEGELKALGFFLTHRVSPILAGFIESKPAQIKAGTTDRMDESTTAKSEIRVYRQGTDSELVMHHEFAKALEQLNWFPGVAA
jgi:hypothetical protein